MGWKSSTTWRLTARIAAWASASGTDEKLITAMSGKDIRTPSVLTVAGGAHAAVHCHKRSIHHFRTGMSRVHVRSYNRRVNRAVAVLIAVFTMASAASFGQSPPPPAPQPAFDVASIKPNRSGERGSGSTTRSGGGYVGTNLTLHQLVTEANRLRPFQVIGGPGWIKTDRFDINARAPEGTTGRPEPMLRSLLADRFKLRTHTETRQEQVYALVVARADGRLGPRLTPSTKECGAGASCGMSLNGGSTSATLSGVAQPLSRLATALSGFGVETIVVDRTGLTGNYDMELHWTPEMLRSAGAGTL